MSTTIQPAVSEPPRAGHSTRRLQRSTFVTQVGLLARRTFIVNLRVPAAILPTLGISLFTLFVYKAQFNSIAGVFLHGKSYLGFILPLSLISAALSGSAVAGQTIASDIGRGYFDKLSLTPANRWALLLGPMLAGGVILALQLLAITLVGVLLGLRPVTGIGGLAAVVGFALLVGIGFSSLPVGIALLSGNAAATSAATFLFFPLTFLTATFVPVDQLEGWIQVAARINPMTYVLEATRGILNDGWDATLLARGLTAGIALAVVLFVFALYGLRTRTRRR